MKFRFFLLFAVLFSLGNLLTVSAQVDSVIGQVTSSAVESFVGGTSGDGRFAVIESNGNIATENPRNADGNREIFLFDYAQRRIFQITDTKSVLTDTTKAATFDNIKVELANVRPVISNNGRWIAFGSNATCAYPGNPTANPPTLPIVSTTNPGNLDGNSTAANPCLIPGPNNTTVNNLVNDGNTEMWLYFIPAAPAADLSSGDEIPFVNLSAGTFTQVTNTLPSRLPVAGTTTSLPIIADDNRDASINDNGSVIAYISTKDIVPCQSPNTPSATCGNAFPNFDNAEVYTYVRATNTNAQVTATPRGTILAPIYNVNPSISGNGQRVAFLSNADNPIRGMTGGSNSDRTDEIFYVELDGTGNPATGGIKRQATTTTAAGQGDIVNVLSYGPRISRDGRYIAFESFADLKNEVTGDGNANATAVFIFDANAPATPSEGTFTRVGPRADADSGASAGDVLRFPTFTDYDANLTPGAVILSTRLNINSAGTIPTNASEGLNPDAARPTQIYAFRLTPDTTVTPNTAANTFVRLTKIPPASFATSTQAYPSNSYRRMTFSLAGAETGTGNFDLQTETYYLLSPLVNNSIVANLNYATGASAIPVSASPVPTPSPTPTPTATPTPSPTPTPTGSPTPTPSPTPQSPPAVQGVSPGMLAIVNIDSGLIEPVTPRTAVGSISRSFQLPIELSGVTMTVNGASVGLKMVSRRQITFVVPLGLTAGSSGATAYPVVINNNGTILRGSLTIVPVRPDIFRNDGAVAAGGRAFIQNVINRVPRNEPFTVTTVRIRGGVRVATVLRVYATGIYNPTLSAAAYTVRIGSTSITSSTFAIQRDPGVYTLDIPLPATLNGAGDQPVVITVSVGGQTFTSRLDDTAPRVRIL